MRSRFGVSGVSPRWPTTTFGNILLGGLAAGALACGGGGGDDAGGGSNPFLDDQSNRGKEDTAYLNPDGIEVEVDLEADVEAPSYRLFDAPAVVGQFALTYLRNRGQFYL